MFPDLPESRTCHCLFSCQVMSDSFATPWTVAHQGPLSMGFSRQECCSGVLFSPPGDLFALGIKPASPALQVDSLPSEPPGLARYFSPYHQWMNEVKSTDLEEAEWWENPALGTTRPEYTLGASSSLHGLTPHTDGSRSLWDGAPCLRAHSAASWRHQQLCVRGDLRMPGDVWGLTVSLPGTENNSLLRHLVITVWPTCNSRNGTFCPEFA